MEKKKVYRLIVAFCLVLALVASIAVYPSEKAFASGGLMASIGTVDGEPGDQVKVSLNITENPGICAFRIAISYDPSLSLVSAENGDIFSDYVFGNQLSANPYYLTWDESLTGDNKKTGTLATLTFKVSDDAVAGVYNISGSCGRGDVFNFDLVDVANEVSGGGIKVTNGSSQVTTAPTSSTPVPTANTPVPTSIVITAAPTANTPAPTSIVVTTAPTANTPAPTSIVVTTAPTANTPVPTASIITTAPTTNTPVPTSSVITSTPAPTATPTGTGEKSSSKTKEITVKGSNGKNSTIKYSVLSKGGSGSASKPGTVKLVSIVSEGKTVIIPDTITVNNKVYYVTSLGKNVLSGNDKVTKVNISKNVTAINPNAFKNMKKLKTITINSDQITKVGKNAFAGIAKGAVIRIKADKETYKKIKEMIEASGVKKGTKFKRIK